MIDTTAPSVTINQAAGQADPTGLSPINFTVVFGEPVSGFASGELGLDASMNLDRQSMPMRVPEGTDVTQEAGLLRNG